MRHPLTHHIARAFGQRLRPARLYSAAHRVNEQFLDWQSQIKAPYFAWLHYMDVHWPYHIEENLTEPEAIAHCWQDLAHLHSVNWKGAATTEQQKLHYLRLYEQAVRHTDAHIGSLLSVLARQGGLDNTLIVVLSDHGEEFLERGRWGHLEVNFYDEIVRVPLLLRLPAQTQPRIVSQQVRTLDIMPTILELCGCPPPDGIEGISLQPLWGDEEAVHPAVVALIERPREPWHSVAARTSSFKYIWNNEVSQGPELYALESDPAERRNVIEAYPAEAQWLHDQVQAHLRRVASTAPGEDAQEPELDAALIERLRGLGYIE